MPHRSTAPTRTLPPRPSLRQLRKQAKELFKSYRTGHAAAIEEVERFETQPDPTSFALADAQRVLARAYGFASWIRLKEHVDGINIEAFCTAVWAGDVVAVRKLAKARPELLHAELSDVAVGFPLHITVLNRDAKMTRVLMQLGADARLGIWPHREATTAYTIASERGYDDILAIIEQEEGRRRKQMSPEGATISSKTEDIHRAILRDRCDEAIRILESDLSLVGACNVEQPLNGIDCRRFAQGATPLHVAAWKHNPQMLAWLLDHQAPVDAQDVHGMTPLDYAATVAGWSAHGRDFSFMENSHQDPSLFYRSVLMLRKSGAAQSLRAAVATGDEVTVAAMHREGALARDTHNRGGLLAIAVRVNRIDMVRLLLDLGLDANEPAGEDDDEAGMRGYPLWFAAMCGRHEIAELLLARGADVNAVVGANADAMYCADRTGDEKMTALLIKRGARITVERVAGNRDRQTARAILDGKIAGQSLNVVDPTHLELAEQMLWAAGGSDPEILRMCLPYIQRKRDDPWWNYVLMHATLPESFGLVLDYGVDPDVVGVGGHTTLHHLAAAGREEQERLTLATMLLDAGASLTRRDELLKSTPLGWACRWGRVGLVKLYLARGADAVEADAEPWATPLSWATMRGHGEIIELLRSHGS